MSIFAPWKVLHVDLSDGIPALPCEPDYQVLYVVFWWHSIPLGHQEISNTQLPMPTTQLANLVLQTITPAVGDRLLEKGFKASLPGLPKHHLQDIPPDFHALMALEQPLATLRERCQEPSGGSVSVMVCTRERPEQLARCLLTRGHVASLLVQLTKCY